MLFDVDTDWGVLIGPCLFCGASGCLKKCAFSLRPRPAPATKCECPQRKFKDGLHQMWCPEWRPY
jgi:hypothetical protein